MMFSVVELRDQLRAQFTQELGADAVAQELDSIGDVCPGDTLETFLIALEWLREQQAASNYALSVSLLGPPPLPPLPEIKEPPRAKQPFSEATMQSPYVITPPRVPDPPWRPALPPPAQSQAMLPDLITYDDFLILPALEAERRHLDAQASYEAELAAYKANVAADREALAVQKRDLRRNVRYASRDGKQWLADRARHQLDDLSLPSANAAAQNTAPQAPRRPHAKDCEPPGYRPDHLGYLAVLEQTCPPLAAFFSLRLRIALPLATRKRHTYITGGTGSGKTELMKLLIHGHVARGMQETVVVLDPHGDMAEQVGQWRDFRRGDDLVYIKPTLSSTHTPVINPLQLGTHTPAEVDRAVSELTQVFERILRDVTFTANMRTTLGSCLKVLLTRENSTLFDLVRFLDDERNSDLVELGCQSASPGTAAFFAHDFYRSNLTPSKDAIAAKLQSLLTNDAFARLLCGTSTVDFTQLLNSRKMIVINLSKGELGEEVSAAMGRFVIAGLQSAVMRRAKQPPQARIPAFLYVDEFQNYVSPTTQTILAESRKYGLHLCLAQQMLGQGMSTDFAKGIMANTAIKLTGYNQDIATLKAISGATKANEDDLRALKRPAFIATVENHTAFRLHPDDKLTGDRHAMKPHHWQQVRQQQLESYYRPIGQPTPQPPAHSRSDTETATTPPEGAVETQNTAVAPSPALQAPKTSQRRSPSRKPLF